MLTITQVIKGSFSKVSGFISNLWLFTTQIKSNTSDVVDAADSVLKTAAVEVLIEAELDVGVVTKANQSDVRLLLTDR